jgi:CheY-like chemotaxis protein
MQEQPLKGFRILIVEDDYVLAVALCKMLEEAGAQVDGPIGWLDDALDFATADGADFDVAILDINLHGAKSYVIADRLLEQRRKFMFLTGYAADAVEPAYRHVPLCVKPCQPNILMATLLGAAGR